MTIYQNRGHNLFRNTQNNFLKQYFALGQKFPPKKPLFCTLFDLVTMFFDSAMKKTGQNVCTTYGLSYETLPSFLVMIFAEIFASD